MYTQAPSKPQPSSCFCTFFLFSSLYSTIHHLPSTSLPIYQMFKLLIQHIHQNLLYKLVHKVTQFLAGKCGWGKLVPECLGSRFISTDFSEVPHTAGYSHNTGMGSKKWKESITQCQCPKEIHSYCIFCLLSKRFCCCMLQEISMKMSWLDPFTIASQFLNFIKEQATRMNAKLQICLILLISI